MRGRRRRRRCSGGRARPTASGPTTCCGPTRRGETRAAGSRAGRDVGEIARAAAIGTARPRRCRSAVRSKPMPSASARW
jgi:hypothetical protein